jgi:hypothetical protein
MKQAPRVQARRDGLPGQEGNHANTIPSFTWYGAAYVRMLEGGNRTLHNQSVGDRFLEKLTAMITEELAELTAMLTRFREGM